MSHQVLIAVFFLCLMLQTFPKDYDFGEEIKTVEVSRHIGNAVPPKLGETIGNCIINHLKEVSHLVQCRVHKI
jgi:site-specific DNA-cytosine methylase